jgi:cytochrome b561
MDSASRYTKTAVVLHWLIAFSIFGMFALGWYMADLPKEAPKHINRSESQSWR